MTLGRCLLSIFCPRGTPPIVLFPAGSKSDAPAEPASPGKAASEEDDTGRKAKELSSPSKAHRKADAMQAPPNSYTLHPNKPCIV